MNHQKTNDRTQENVSAKYARGRNRNDTRQEHKCRIGYHVEEAIPVTAGKSRKRLTKGLDKTHHKTGSYDRRKNRNEYVADRLEQFLPERLFLCRRCLDVILCRSSHTGNIKELVIYLVYGTGADDELKLSV